MNWLALLANISIWIILLPFIIGLAGFKRLNYESRIVFFVVLAGLIPQVLRPFLNNSSTLTVLYNLYTPVDFTLYFLLFLSKMRSVFNRKFLYLSLFLFIAVSLILIFKKGLQQNFLNELVIFNHVMQICWVCLCLMEYYKTDEAFIETRQPFFWFLSGITAYASCTIIFYSLWNIVKSDEKGPMQLLKLIHHFFNIMLYIFFSIGLMKNYRPKKSHKLFIKKTS